MKAITATELRTATTGVMDGVMAGRAYRVTRGIRCVGSIVPLHDRDFAAIREHLACSVPEIDEDGGRLARVLEKLQEMEK